jgi:hypothetical protein
MNIFFLDLDPSKAAEYHCDKHVVKMILETVQMLFTVASHYGHHEPWMTKPCYHKHPCTIWAGSSRENARWLTALGISLCAEYTRRYHKQHKMAGLLRLFQAIDWYYLPDVGLTFPALAMPDDCKLFNPVRSYRRYYRLHKRHIAFWKTQAPVWYY